MLRFVLRILFRKYPYTADKGSVVGPKYSSFVSCSMVRRVAAITVWLAAIAAGFTTLFVYSVTPGAVAGPPARWPSASILERKPSRWTLLMFVHPRCVCSRASLEELSVILRQTAEPLRTQIVFLRPGGLPAEWSRTAVWQDASALPHASVLVDEDGKESARFGATTSGFTLLYAPDGKLQFSGGITERRGQVGDNAGRFTILSILNARHGGGETTPVFGCPLRDGGSPS